MTAAVIRFPIRARCTEQPNIPPLWEMVLLLQRAMERTPAAFGRLDRAIVAKSDRIAQQAEDGPSDRHILYLRYCAHLLAKHCLLAPATYYIEPPLPSEVDQFFPR